MPRFVLATLLVLFLPSLLAPPAAALPQSTPASLTQEEGTSNDVVAAERNGFEAKVDAIFERAVTAVSSVLMYDISKLWGSEVGLRLIVVWLLIGGVFLTLRMGFINLRAFGHATRVVRGKYDNPSDAGEVTHFQALASALSATVGLGNIGGVAIAVATGGPGAVFWLIAAGFFGMTMKFTECTLGQKYRTKDRTGHITGGAMHYLYEGLKERGAGGVGKVLATLFAVLCILASFGGGNSFQVNQSLGVIRQQFDFIDQNTWIYGVIMAVAVAVVIIGGIKRIAKTAEKIVPTMCLIYVSAALWIILANVDRLGWAMGHIFSEAFTAQAGYGGFIGVLMIGIQRAVFSNEAGVGSAAIAHSAAKTDEPIREGLVALLEPFIDTIVVCTMTGLVIVITGVYDPVAYPEYSSLIAGKDGAALTSKAFAQSISWFPYVLSVAVVLFAYSTMISWSYYGERCWVHLFGDSSSLLYKLLFVSFCYMGSIVTSTNILEFSDLMILSMAFPNLIGLYVMSGAVRADLTNYMDKLKSGVFPTYK